MTRVIYDKFLTLTSSGETLPSGTLQVNNTTPNTNLTQLYDSREGGALESNPFTADANGRVTFYLEPGRYTMQAVGAGGDITYQDVNVSAEGDSLEFIKGTINSVERPDMNEYLDGKEQPDYTSLRAALAAGAYVAGDQDINVLSPAGDSGYVAQDLTGGQYIDNDNDIIVGGATQKWDVSQAGDYVWISVGRKPNEFRQLPNQNYREVHNPPAVDFSNERRTQITDQDDKDDLLLIATNWNYVFFTEPVVLGRPDGRILAFATAQYNTVNSNPPDPGQSLERADVIVKISDTNGVNWQDIKIVATQGDDYQNWVGGVAYDQTRNRIWVGFTSYKGLVGAGHSLQGFDENTTAQQYVTYSDDNGDTWSTPENITTKVKDPNKYFTWLPPVSAVTQPDGTICMTMSTYKTQGGSIDVNFIRLREGSTEWEFGEKIVDDDDYTESGGGETSLFIGRQGRLSAVVRGNTPQITTNQLVYERDENGVWSFVASTETTQVKCGVYYTDPKLGFDRGRLLITAAIGELEMFEGRRNPWLYDGYAGTPIGRLSPKYAPLNEVFDYSDICYMGNGTFLCLYVGLTANMYCIMFTPDRVVGSSFVKPPFMGTKRIASSELDDSKIDLVENEIVFDVDAKAYWEYDGTDYQPIAGQNQVEQQIGSVVTTIDADAGAYVRFLVGADTSSITTITNGRRIGQTLNIYVSSSSANITFVDGAPGTDNIQINPDGASVNLAMVGNNVRFAQFVWLGAGIGWNLNGLLGNST